MELNSRQKHAISSQSPVVVVIAGAGSGKTSVLTQKIATLINEGVAGEEILAVTFTNKATAEMKQRILQDVGPAAGGVLIATFHSFAVRVIRENIAHLPHHDHNFLIIDEEDKRKIIKSIMDKTVMDNQYKVTTVSYQFSHAKAFSKTFQQVKSMIDSELVGIYEAYTKYCQENNAFDFDDLLLYCYKLLQTEAVASRYQKRFNYICVDEYQDTSAIQGEILKLIKGETTNLFIVGDVDQSIYEWRGATISNIMELDKTYPQTEIIKLEQNYRSTKNILDAANSLIINNEKRYEKNLWTEKKGGAKINYKKFQLTSQEADYVASEINYLIDFGSEQKEIAVLYRYNYQSKKIEEELMKRQIAYKLYGGIRFYERREVKDIIAYLRLINNHDDNISFLRVINVPKRSIGDKTVAKIVNYAEENNLSYFTACEELGVKNAKSFIQLIKEYQSKLTDSFSNSFDELLLDLDYTTHLAKDNEPSMVEERMNNVAEIKYAINVALETSTLTEYINDLILFSEKTSDEEADGVILSTIHGVKGLEFENVFMIGLNENVFPRLDKTLAEIEEERRICYVGITRAKKKLYVSSVMFTNRGDFVEDSRFINEMGIEGDQDVKTGFIF